MRRSFTEIASQQAPIFFREVEARVLELRILSNSVTSSIFRKKLISDACTCYRILLVIIKGS